MGLGPWAWGLTLAVCLSGTALAQPSGPLSVPPPGKAALEAVPMLKDVGIDQKLDSQLPLDAAFVDHTGKDVKLRDLFSTRPAILALVYYECPMLCTQVLNGLEGSLEALSFTLGTEYDLIVVSFDPGETPAMAAEKRKTFLHRYGRKDVDASAHFLTGREESIKRLTSAVGWRYAYDAAIDQYAHPAAITLVTAAGRVSRYLYGIEFAPKDLKFGLMDASGGKIGTLTDQMLLFCYHYDPESGKYGVAIMNLVRFAGAATVVCLVTYIVWSVRRERRLRARLAHTATGIR
jgi:protein SCO1/2